MDIIMINFLIGSYAAGWAITGFFARRNRQINLCQFVRYFIFAPIAVCTNTMIYMALRAIFPSIFANLLIIAQAVLLVVGSCIAIGLIGHFVIRPVISKSYRAAYGIAKPISNKLCIVIYRKPS